MMRAHEVVAAGAWTGEPADSVVLDFDERLCRRAALTAVGGLAFQLDLADDTMLRGGDGLKLEDGRVVEVVAAPEPLFEIRAPDPLALVRIALRLGSRHALAEATPRALRVRRDPDIEALAKGFGARVTPVEAPFNPEGAAYVMAEAREHDHGHHHHGHDHGHHHHHDHGHNHHHDHGHDHDNHHGRGHDHAHAHDHSHADDHADRH